MQFSDISKELILQVDAVAEESHNKVSEWESSSIIRVWNNGKINMK